MTVLIGGKFDAIPGTLSWYLPRLHHGTIRKEYPLGKIGYFNWRRKSHNEHSRE
jgi:hypothetical protein